MVAVLPHHNIERLVAVLQNKHSVSVSIGPHQLKDISTAAVTYTNRKKIDLPLPEEKPAMVISMLELEAEALALELELLVA